MRPSVGHGCDRRKDHGLRPSVGHGGDRQNDHHGIKDTELLDIRDVVRESWVKIVGERSNFNKFPTHTQDHGDA